MTTLPATTLLRPVRLLMAFITKTQLLCSYPRIGQRYDGIANREIREILYGHYRIPYLIVDESIIEILGVFHGAMEIERYLATD